MSYIVCFYFYEIHEFLRFFFEDIAQYFQMTCVLTAFYVKLFLEVISCALYSGRLDGNDHHEPPLQERIR